MLVKNLKTGVVWAVTEKHGKRLLRDEDFEKADYVEDERTKKSASSAFFEPLTELPEYEKVTVKHLKAELVRREITFNEKADKQELYDLVKAEIEKVGD